MISWLVRKFSKLCAVFRPYAPPEVYVCMFDRKMDVGYFIEYAKTYREYIRSLERLNRFHLLAKLDETDRKLLLAFSLEGKPTKQIAREMNLSDGQVRVRLHRIRRKLKKGLNDDA